MNSWPCNKLQELYDKTDINSFGDIINSDGIEMYDHDVVIPQSIVAKIF